MLLKQRFTRIYERNTWGSKESVSGPGSTMEQTENIRAELPHLFAEYGIRSILDIPCGDFHWMKEVMKDAPKYFQYTGADIVPEIIANNNMLYKSDNIHFEVMDVTRSRLPKVDLILVRDCLGHLQNNNVRRALHNIHQSSSKYLLSTTFTDPKWKVDADIRDGGWRPINLSVQFKMGEPLTMIDEELTAANGSYRDKVLALWRL